MGKVLYLTEEDRKQALRNNSKRWRSKNSQSVDYKLRAILVSAKIRAEEKGIPFDIELEDITVPDFCPILGIPINFNNSKDSKPSLDRIVNHKGYTKENVAVISMRANRIKSDASLRELKAIVEFLEKHNG